MRKLFRVLGLSQATGWTIVLALLYALLVIVVVVGSHPCRPDSDSLACQALVLFAS